MALSELGLWRTILKFLAITLLFSSPLTSKESGAITDVSRYSELLKKVNLDSPTSIFPSQIPEGANHVSFNFFPGTTQSGGHIILKYEGKEKDIQKKVEQTVSLKNVHLKNELNLSALGFIPKDFTLYLTRFIGSADGSNRYSVTGFATKKDTIIIFHIN